MAHEYGHARPLWGIQQLKDFWEWEKHPWNVTPPKDWKGVYPSESQWEAQSGITADKWRQFRDVESRSGSRRPETDMQIMERLRKAQPSVEYGYPMALSSDEHGMYGQAQKDIAAGKYAPKEEEEDEYASLLRMMFLSELMAGMAGGDPPTPYTVQAGPAARAFPTMPSMMG
jgi:hypothetical protein